MLCQGKLNLLYTNSIYEYIKMQRRFKQTKTILTVSEKKHLPNL